MRKAIVIGSIVALAVIAAAHLTGRTALVPHGSSPAFEALLTEAIARLEGATQEITATTVGEAHASGKQFETMAGEPTCYGSPTCDRDQPECWDLTYSGEPTCYAAEATCDATDTC